MENRLNDASRQQYELVVRDASSSLSATFTARAKKFDGNHTFFFFFLYFIDRTEKRRKIIIIIIKIPNKMERGTLLVSSALPGGGNVQLDSRVTLVHFN
jgi:hypothetical protein